MFLIILLLVMVPVAAVFCWCRRWLPSNILVGRVRTRAGLRWGIPLALLGLVYFAVGVVCAGMVQTGGPGWWYAPMAVCWWTALKLVGHGLFATVMLPVARTNENLAVRRALREERLTARDQGKPIPVRTRDERLRLTHEVRADMIADRDVLV